LTFARDGRTLAIGYYDGVVEIWDTQSDEGRIRVETEPRPYIALNSSGGLLASWSLTNFPDGLVQFWDVSASVDDGPVFELPRQRLNEQLTNF
jgi:WD40 repeat protein